MIVNIDKRNKDRFILLLSFICTMLMCLSLAYIAKLAPFGDKTLIISDSSSQYTSFWSYFRDLLCGRQDPFYSLEMTMGNNVTGLLGYYCISPFNLLFLLFPLSKMPLAIHIIVMLKLSFSSLFMAVFFKNSHGITFKSLIFTTSYAFCGYILSYAWCLMWLDGFMLLPLIALGLKYISTGKKPWLYIFSLGSVITFNYYIGFMLCIFSVLYFIALLISLGERPKLKTLSTFAFSSLCAGGLSAVIILPSLMSMQNSKRVPFTKLLKKQIETVADFFVSKLPSGLKTPEIIKALPYFLLGILILSFILLVVFCSRKKISVKIRVIVFSVYCLFLLSYGAIYESNGFFMHKLLIGFSGYEEMTNGYPALYSGIFPLLMAVFYFFSNKIGKNEKLGAAFILLSLIFSMHFKLINMVWHGFTANSMFNYRYAFIFSFILICLGEKAFSRLDSFSLKHAAELLSAILLLIVISKISPKSIAGNRYYFLIIIEAVLTCILLYFIYRNNTPKPVKSCLWCVITLICTLSLMSQSLLSIKSLCGDESMSEFETEISGLKEQTDVMKEYDSGLYRANIGARINAPMMLGYNGMSHFSSNEETTVVEFAKKLGVASYENIWSSIAFGRTAALESFFGVKYITEPNNPHMYEKLPSGLYRGKYSLPLAFPADKRVLDTELSSENAFQNQNTLFNSVCPNSEDIFTEPEMLSKEFNNLKKISENEYELKDKNKSGEIIYKFKTNSTDSLYFYSEGYRGHVGKLYINGKYISDINNEFDWRTIYLGDFNAHEEITLELRLENGSDGTVSDEVHVCCEKSDALKEYYTTISGAAGTTVSDTDSHMITEICAEDDSKCLLYTIPYSKAWHVTVDGEKVKGEEAFGLMLAVPIEKGVHRIEIKYVPPGLWTGTVISCCSLIAAVSSMVISKKKRKINKI